MKYTNIIKYVNGFNKASDSLQISQARLEKLCERLGRINIGDGYIYMYGGGYAHACACAVENMMLSAGYGVCRISDIYSYDITKYVYINSEPLKTESIVEIFATIRSAVKKLQGEEFLYEEIMFASALYAAKVFGAGCVILENSSDIGCVLSNGCKYYNYAVIPKFYSPATEEELQNCAKVIEKVNRGVVTGNNSYYKYFSSQCQRFGIRLSIHRSYECVTDEKNNVMLNYGKNYRLNSPSEIFADAVISAIELVELMKVHGIKLPPKNMVDGIEKLPRCFLMEKISINPQIMLDVSSTVGEIKLLCDKLHELSGDKLKSINVWTDNKDVVEKCFNEYCKELQITVNSMLENEKFKGLALRIIKCNDDGVLNIVIGSFEFASKLKDAYCDVMNRL